MEELFSFNELQVTDSEINTTLYINKDSIVFNGHFPSQPVVPGACMLQVVKEVLEQGLSDSFRLKKAGNLKFISMVDPGITPSVQLNLFYKTIDDAISVTAKISNGDTTCFKFQGAFTKI